MSIGDPSAEQGSKARWRARSALLSMAVRVAVFMVPIDLSIASAVIVAHLLPRPHGTGWLLGWWAVVLCVPNTGLSSD